MAASERAALAKAIEAQIGPPNPYYPDLATEDLVREAALSATVEVISLNKDEKESREVVAEGQGNYFCGATGNCSLWFFRRTSHGYALLLDAIGQGYTVQETTTNGFRDLVVNMHGSATEQWLKVYRYANDRYWRVACYDADWTEQRLTPSPCN